MTMSQLWWTLFSYLCGALPFAPWLGRLAGVDIRQVGDGNPGATNVLKGAGLSWGIAAYALEFSKAAAPVGLARFVFDWTGWPLVAIALAPTLGHAFNVFQRGQGGKALATILGAWIGLTLYELPLVILPCLILLFLLLENDGWAVLLTALVAGGYLLLFNREPLLLTVLALQLVVVIWTHRHDLARPPRLRERWRKRPDAPPGNPPS